jgi:anti-sigma factor RsiW
MRAHLQGCAACGEEHASLHALVAGEQGAPRAPAGGEPGAA